jgi:hypothetical protein
MFPFDEQRCGLSIESLTLTDLSMSLKWQDFDGLEPVVSSEGLFVADYMLDGIDWSEHSQDYPRKISGKSFDQNDHRSRKSGHLRSITFKKNGGIPLKKGKYSRNVLQNSHFNHHLKLFTTHR